MPIKIPDNLPARRILEREGVLLIRENDAIRQDVRPMRIALLNLMPEKIKTETQLARVIASSPLQVEMTLLKTSSYTPTNISAEHMLAFYVPWSEVAHEKFDGLIITGAPVEEIPFEDVDYWLELTEIFDWARVNVSRSLNICWGAQAALYHHYGVAKHPLDEKLSGVYEHGIVTPNSSLLRGFPDRFLVPVSRHTETRRDEIERLLAHDTVVVVDEAYAEFAGENAVGLMADHDNLIIIRTFSKWAGLAGLRAGYAVVPPDLVEIVWRAKVPYNLSVASEQAILASLDETDSLLANVRLIVEERERLRQRLSAMDWLRPYPSAGNFVLCEVRGIAGSDVRDRLRERGILVRYVDEPALRNCIRISVGLPKDTDRVVDALSEIGANVG